MIQSYKELIKQTIVLYQDYKIKNILSFVPAAIFPAIIFPPIFLDNIGNLDLDNNSDFDNKE